MMIERRAAAVELRAKGRRLVGYAARFGVSAKIADFTESIRPGAFSKTLAAGKDILALCDHSPDRVLGRTRSGTLQLAEDERGLHFEISVPDTNLGRDVLVMAERGDIGGASFAFTPVDEIWDGDRRELRAVELHEVSIVSSWPAYPQTIVQARSRPVLFPRVAVVRRFLETL